MFEKYDVRNKFVEVIGHSYKKTYITPHGVVLDDNFTPLETRLDSNGNVEVELVFLGALDWYKVADLVACHFKFLPKKPEVLKLVQAFHIDGNKSNNHANNIGYRFTVVPLELENTGYYYIPGYPKRYINENGEIVTFKDGKLATVNLKTSIPNKDNNPKNITGGYKVTVANITSEVRVTISRHRAMLLAFKNIPDNIESLVCNHINGIPGDDRLENLEWVTRKRNLAHAYESGLRSQNRPVLVRNILTGEIKEYFSVSEAAKHIGCNDRGLNQMLEQRPFGSLNRLGYQIKYSNDEREWVDFEDVEKELKIVRQSIAIKARDCKTMKEYSFSSVNEAGRATNINSASILFRINKEDYSPLFGWQFIPEDSIEEFPKFSKEEYISSLTPVNFVVDCKNLYTGETLKFDSVAKTEKHFNYHSIANCLREGIQPVLANGWTVKYEWDEWKEIDDIEKATTQRNNTITARNYLENKIYILDNKRQFNELCGKAICIDKIRDMVNSNGEMAYKGWQLRAGEDIKTPFPEVNEHYNSPYKVYRVEYPDGVVKIMKARDVINTLELKEYDLHNRLKRNAKHVSDKYPDVKVTIFKQ